MSKITYHLHSKLMRVDDDISWIGTSNWSHSYFHDARNLEVVLRIKPIARKLDILFYRLWDSEYTYPVDPDKEYEPPRIR